MSTVRFAAFSLLLAAVCSIARSGTCPPTRAPRKFVVGDDKGWTFGFNYTDWAFKNGPFFTNDVLVFRYPHPVEGEKNNSVHLLKDFRTFQNCILDGSKRIGDEFAGGGANGLEVKLDKKASVYPSYYFANGQRKGLDCDLGSMKFMVNLLFRG